MFCCQKWGSTAFLALVAAGQSQRKIPEPAWTRACSRREFQPSSSSSSILFPPCSCILCARWEWESSKGSKTRSVPQPQTQQSTRGLHDLFQVPENTNPSNPTRQELLLPLAGLGSHVRAGWAPLSCVPRVLEGWV